MSLVAVLVVLALVGVVAAVVTGAVRGDLDEPASNLAPSGLPEGELFEDDVRDVRFSLGFRGYRMDEVDEVLDRVGSELARRDAELAELRHRIAELAQGRAGDLAADRDPQQVTDHAIADPGVAGSHSPLGPGPADARRPAASAHSPAGPGAVAAQRTPGGHTAAGGHNLAGGHNVAGGHNAPSGHNAPGGDSPAVHHGPPAAYRAAGASAVTDRGFDRDGDGAGLARSNGDGTEPGRAGDNGTTHERPGGRHLAEGRLTDRRAGEHHGRGRHEAGADTDHARAVAGSPGPEGG